MSEQTEHPPFIKDRLILLLVVVNSLLAVINTLSTLVRLRSHDFKIPVQYLTRDGSVLQTSNWYSLYALALFSIAGVILTIILSERLYHGNRWFAVTVLLLYIIVSLVSFLVINALLGLVARV